jgi:hypothetical protein
VPVGEPEPGEAETATREELRDVEDELAQLRVEIESLHSLFGSRSAGPVDLVESASAITSAEEQQALLEALEGRRDALRRKLGLET